MANSRPTFVFADSNQMTFLANGNLEPEDFTPVMEWDAKTNQSTDTPVVDDQGRKTYKVPVLVRSNGKAVEGWTVRVHEIPAALNDLTPLELVNPRISVWAHSSKGTDFVSMVYTIDADSIKAKGAK